MLADLRADARRAATLAATAFVRSEAA